MKIVCGGATASPINDFNTQDPKEAFRFAIMSDNCLACRIGLFKYFWNRI